MTHARKRDEIISILCQLVLPDVIENDVSIASANLYKAAGTTSPREF